MIKIGLEIHEQLKTNTKLFCNCPTNYRDMVANTLICPVCSSQPGSKPFGINKDAYDAAVKIALFLGCELVTDKPVNILRKHYFYPDLPSNYQKTSQPIGVKGHFAGINITEVHIEEDPGRYELREGTVDYNRSGIPLIEIVTDPDMRSPQEARDFLKKLRLALEYLNVVREEAGTMRVDANLSVDDMSRVEVKNINSFKGVFQALNSEIRRHQRLIQFGGKIDRETRHWDEKKQLTVTLRKKETAADYRFIPDPDIPPLLLTQDLINDLRKTLPELPAAKAKRFIEAFYLDEDTADVLVADLELADFFEEVAKQVDPKIASTWVKDELRRVLNYNNARLRDTTFTAGEMAELLSLFQEGIITDRVAKRILEWAVQTPRSLRKLVKDMGLAKISEKDEITALADKIISENMQAVNDYVDGKEEAINFLIGKIMVESGGKADPIVSRDILRNLILQGNSN